MDEERTLLGNLAGALMREVHPEKASAIIQRVVEKAMADGIFEELVEV